MIWRVALFLGLSACTAQIGSDTQQIRAALTPQRVAALQVPMILIETSKGSAATLLRVGQNGSVTTWQTRDGVQVSTQAGIVVASRGFGHDLMASDVSGVVAALSQGGGHYTRQWSHFDGDFGVSTESARCDLSAAGIMVHDGFSGPVRVTRYEERCQGSGGPIVNRYDIDDMQNIWWSEQWLSAELGYVNRILVRP